jgi:hypothetical protein
LLPPTFLGFFLVPLLYVVVQLFGVNKATDAATLQVPAEEGAD